MSSPALCMPPEVSDGFRPATGSAHCSTSHGSSRSPVIRNGTLRKAGLLSENTPESNDMQR